MHDNLFVRNVSFAIRKRTFAATSLNARFGSIPVIEGTRFRYRRTSGYDYLQTFWGLLEDDRFAPKCRHRQQVGVGSDKAIFGRRVTK